MLAIFLSAGKRLGEKEMLGESSGQHRKSLDAYPEGTLDGFMYISGAAVLVTYTMYVITMHKLVFTVPLCCFGLFRYIMLVKRGDSGDPTDSLDQGSGDVFGWVVVDVDGRGWDVPWVMKYC